VLAPAVRPPQQKAADAAIQERLQPVLDELLSPHSSAEGFYNRRAGPHRNASIDETRLDTEFVEPAKIRRVIGAYAPLATEPDVVPCLRALALAGFPLALPVCEPESRIMSWVVWDGGLEALQGQSPFNLRTSTDGSGLAEAPREPDILVVPLVAFDHQLQRLGRGGGFYDATISDLQTRKRIVTIGLAYEAQALTAESHHEEGEFAPKVGATGVHASSAAGSHQHWWEDHDMALDIIVTECNILRHEKEP
jgi:5-formyltetrahydrofolate cyclo-ligase